MVGGAAVASKQQAKKARKTHVYRRRDAATLDISPCLSVNEIERLTGWSRKRIYEFIAKELLLTYRIGRRRFATRRAVDACIASLEAAA